MSKIVSLWKKEPAVIIGAAVAGLLAVQQAVSDGHPRWSDLIVVAVSAVIRQFVTPAAN